MTYDELYRALLAICPQGEMGHDNDGQLVFYTNVEVYEKIDGTGYVRDMDEQ